MLVKNGLLLLVFIVTISCASRKDVVLFQGEHLQEIAVGNYISKYKPNDLLTITVSALDMETVRPFNLTSVSYTTVAERVAGTPSLQTYLIGEEGSILFPVIGRLLLKGLSRLEAEELLTEKIGAYVQHPIVSIRIVNYKISVLGEVKNPGVFTIANERVSLIEALGLAGDLTIQGKRDNVLVIREIAGRKQFKRIDLTGTDFFDSSNYYLQQNDIIYVSPNKSRVNFAAASPSTGVIISVTSLLITILALLIR